MAETRRGRRFDLCTVLDLAEGALAERPADLVLAYLLLGGHRSARRLPKRHAGWGEADFARAAQSGIAGSSRRVSTRRKQTCRNAAGQPRGAARFWPWCVNLAVG